MTQSLKKPLLQGRCESESHGAFAVFPRAQEPSVSPVLRAVDLFCGAGGISEGLRMAGYESVLGIDVWAPACETFAHNHPTSSVIRGDITAVPSDAILSFAGAERGQIGVVSGGPPCQGFSVAGKGLADDPRNYLYRHFLRAVEVLAPEWVIMENVPQLLKHPEVASSIYRDFAQLDLPAKWTYQVQHFVANAADYGVTLTRTRVLFVARRGDVQTREPFDFPKVMNALFVEHPDFLSPRYISVEEAIGDLPQIRAGEGSEEMPYSGEAVTEYQRLMRGQMPLTEFFRSKGLVAPAYGAEISESRAVYNHLAQKHKQLLIDRFDHIPPGGSKEDLRKRRPDLLPPEGHPSQGLTYGRLWRDRPAPTIPANYSRPSGNRSIHPTIPRLITPREVMRLSSFPDSYRLSGQMVAQREQVGNAVPPLLIYHVARHIRSVSKVQG